MLLKSLAALKAATKSGTAEMKQSEKADGMVQALMDMALFCDRALRACEDGNGSSLDTEVSHTLIYISCILYMHFMSGTLTSLSLSRDLSKEYCF